MSDDGRWALISEFTAEIYLHVIDVSVPSQPRLVATQPLDGGAHTVDCIDAACNVVYGSEGQMIDLSDKTQPRVLENNWMTIAEEQIRRRTGNPAFELERRPRAQRRRRRDRHHRHDAVGHARCRRPARTTRHHDVRRRPDGQGSDRVPAQQPASAGRRVRAARGRSSERRDKRLRPGELIMGNGETNFTGNCGPGNGPFATYSAKGFDEGRDDPSFSTCSGPSAATTADGNPAVNAMGCSGHWFTTTPDGDDELVAAAWYDHGTRFLRVDGDTGAISQLGFFQPGVGAASAAHWIDGEHAYVVDYERGIDILRFDRSAPVPSDRGDRRQLAGEAHAHISGRGRRAGVLAPVPRQLSRGPAQEGPLGRGPGRPGPGGSAGLFHMAGSGRRGGSVPAIPAGALSTWRLGRQVGSGGGDSGRSCPHGRLGSLGWLAAGESREPCPHGARDCRGSGSRPARGSDRPLRRGTRPRWL